MSDQLPSVTSNIPRDLRTFIDRLRGVLGGAGRSKIVTAGDLLDAGVISVNTAGKISGVSDPLLGAPPAPTSVVATAAIQNIIVEWDDPRYYGHALAQVWGASANNLGAAVLIGTAPGSIYVDSVGPSTTRYYWVRFANTAGEFGAYNSISGTSATTGSDVAYTLGLLAGAVTESELATNLNNRLDLIDAPTTGLVTLLSNEVTDRAYAVQQEAAERADAVIAESSARTAQAKESAEALLRSVVATHQEQLSRSSDVAIARFDLTDYVNTGISAEASARLTLAAKLNTDIGTTLAIINDEAVARVTADAAEATARNLLSAQLLGSDGTSLNSGLIYSERALRVSEDQALAQQITLLSAGAGEQFDWQSIWYFDSGTESWTGNGTPTATQGFLRPADQATGAYVESPAGIGADGAKYNQLRLRVRKVGSPIWAAYLWWRSSEDIVWTTAKRVALSEPTWDLVTNIGLVTATPSWSGGIDRIRIDASSAQSATEYFEFDWVSIGRPSPGASSAQLTQEQQTRAAADTAISESVTTLSAQVNDSVTGLPATRATLTSDYYTKTDADSATASAQTTLIANYNATKNRVFRQATQPVQTDSAGVALSDGTTYTPKLLATGDWWIDTGNGNKPYSWRTTDAETGAGVWDATSDTQMLDTQAFLDSLDTALTSSQSATTAAWRTAVSKVDIPDGTTLTSQIDTLETTFATVSDASARSEKMLSSGIAQLDESALRNILATHATDSAIRTDLAVATVSLATDFVAGISAEASARLALSATVASNTAAITAEQVARVDADGVIAQSVTTLSAQVNDTVTGLPAAQSRITSVEDTKIGYCTIGGAASDYTTKGTCEAAGGVWNIGLPLATAVKQVTISDGATSATLETRAAAQKTLDDQFKLQYSIKLDNNGHVSGYGLYSATSGGSEFIANVDKFAVTTPTSSIPVRANSTAYTVNAIARIEGNDAKTLVCKIAGTSGGVAPSISGAIGSTITDGTVTWQIASRVPFSVLSAPTTINGQSVAAGVYIDAAYVLNATIQTAQIASSAVDNSKIDDAAITSAKIDDAAITSAKIDDAAITSAKIGQAAVGTLNLVNGCISELYSSSLYGLIRPATGANNADTSTTLRIQIPKNEYSKYVGFISLYINCDPYQTQTKSLFVAVYYRPTAGSGTEYRAFETRQFVIYPDDVQMSRPLYTSISYVISATGYANLAPEEVYLKLWGDQEVYLGYFINKISHSIVEFRK